MSTNHPRSEFFTFQKLTQTTYLTKHIPTSTLYIEKRTLPTQSTSPSILREIAALTRLKNHPHIISLFAYISTDPYTSLYLQHCPLGSLDNFIKNGIVLPDEGFLWKIFWDLALAVCFLTTGYGYEETRLLALGGSVVEGKKGGWEKWYG
ncbi:SPS1 Serine threonine protein kinase [Pyrenophora tritici-repentis]|uniref:Protein kinase domain containing protein n=2 Tax=Pyrenophora tritici-repentis TaxID=45151 RepID=A0A2W1EPU2_9PLEO|nr:uncharacterized protein PTRG_10898 [Pyrenophora tritici-repentis Pt-1C-BFP]KAA8618071.1 SPS1 Serine-threonine protein kinase [Pyrenophora tritici-repentis]EDU43948.1 conserved hypothetical protein [Pyrenophora tritici-repentis Pt-1C-BFP]KAF7442967.1 SPS1 Serine-threonine protein kinase [Pyrenophora tritici-repentis]KAG9376480.1 SPS1 Serine-threonine protein kinase [Pyrenophora tritici-repentis]KAI0586486.1 SPS1 Serine-threonine protein kinase [Pyrenophora tritici-repentis]